MNEDQWDNLAFALFAVALVLVVAAALFAAALVALVAAALFAAALVAAAGANPKLMVALELISIGISISAIIYAIPYIDAPTVQVVCFHTVTNSQIVINGTATITQTHTAVTNQTMTELASRSYTC